MFALSKIFAPHKTQIIVLCLGLLNALPAQAKIIVGGATPDPNNPKRMIYSRMVDGVYDKAYAEFFLTFDFSLFTQFDENDRLDIFKDLLRDATQAKRQPGLDPQDKMTKRDSFLNSQLNSITTEQQIEIYLELIKESNDPQIMQYYPAQVDQKFSSYKSKIVCELFKGLTTYSDGKNRDLFGLGYNFKKTQAYNMLLNTSPKSRENIYCQFDPNAQTYSVDELIAIAEREHQAIEQRAGRATPPSAIPQALARSLQNPSPSSCQNYPLKALFERCPRPDDRAKNVANLHWQLFSKRLTKTCQRWFLPFLCK